MSLTNLSTILKILISGEIIIPDIFNEQVKLLVYDQTQMQNKNISSGSERVKIIRQSAPSANAGNPVTLINQVPVSLSHQLIVPNTVVVASSLFLSTVYVENADFIIDYFNGTIERTSTGSTITSGGQVYVWYLPFTQLNQSDDYSLDYVSGKIKRKSGSSIPDKATVFVDYAISTVDSFSDTQIEELIKEMEAYIAPHLKPSYSITSTDEGLKAAATNYVLYLCCLSGSLNTLNYPNDISNKVSDSWLKLSEKYFSLASELFRTYLSTPLPSFSASGTIENRYLKARSIQKVSPSLSRGYRQF